MKIKFEIYTLKYHKMSKSEKSHKTLKNTSPNIPEYNNKKTKLKLESNGPKTLK